MPQYINSPSNDDKIPAWNTGTSERCVAISSDLLVQALLYHHDSVFEKRIQALAFASELEWVMSSEKSSPHCDRLSDATFQRAPRGVYSPEIRAGLKQTNRVFSRLAYSDGHRTRKFNVRDVPDPRETGNYSDEETEAMEIVESVCKEAARHSDDTLMEWCLTVDGIEQMDNGQTIHIENVVDSL